MVIVAFFNTARTALIITTSITVISLLLLIIQTEAKIKADRYISVPQDPESESEDSTLIDVPSVDTVDTVATVSIGDTVSPIAPMSVLSTAQIKNYIEDVEKVIQSLVVRIAKLEASLAE